ncbi:MAG: 2-C-methyl-D-erythritol 4-phosphate cytidylyltransferase [Candidatus Omnitrophota bacterium]|nr:MAG: 2-C-methyl-D-erythritol 4-phosphate cytidylyltransferase [Candidatus Omnitrophota bacterium]
MNAGAVIVCAGSSRRLGNIDKPVFKLGDNPLFYHSFKAFAGIKEIKEIVLVLREKHLKQAKELIPPRYRNKRVLFVCGGRQRCHSVYNGLVSLGKKTEYVLIHDGARPFVSRKLIRRILGELVKHPAVICGIEVGDTVKKVEAGFVSRTLERSRLFSIQTPQAFKKDLILGAYKKLRGGKVFDDSQVLEMRGEKIKVIAGDRFNIKITYPQDIVLAKAIYRRGKFN